MKRIIFITSIVVAVVVIILIIVNISVDRKDISNLYTEPERGQFDILVVSTGELQAENSIEIRGPEFAQNMRIRAMDIMIQDLVPEGTEVQTGDYIATLDKTSFDNTLKDELERLETSVSNLEMQILDTSVTLSNLRDNIKNLTFSVEEAKINLEQSQYEPPTTIRQAEIALDRTLRSLLQAKRAYSLRIMREQRDMRFRKINLEQQQQRVIDLETLLSKFIITAPAPGMVIYSKNRMGVKRKVGSSISPYDNVVATLPDMSSMVSKTYVNEIDISKVIPGQRVIIKVDAFPENSYTGVVTSVSNIGEQLPNADAKVFEVLIKIDRTDPILRPSMTTGNQIIIKSLENVTFIPLECVQTSADSIPFVYLRNGNRQIVVLGESNENSVIVEKGLDTGVEIYMSPPSESRISSMLGEDLIPIIKARKEAKRNE